MKVTEFIKTNKIPQKVLAKKIGIGYSTFRKKLNTDGYNFTPSELSKLKGAVVDYLEETLVLAKNII